MISNMILFFHVDDFLIDVFFFAFLLLTLVTDWFLFFFFFPLMTFLTVWTSYTRRFFFISHVSFEMNEG